MGRRPLAVQPTVELANRLSRQRIDPLLEETPALRERVAPARARDSGNTLLPREFPGRILVLTGANSAVGLRSMTARFLCLDEVDAIPAMSPARVIRSHSPVRGECAAKRHLIAKKPSRI